MSVLEKIRSRTGLLVGIIGLALIIFVLESLLGSGGSLFSGDDTLIGKIAGDKIDYSTFNNKVNEVTNQWQQGNPNASLDDKTKEQITESVWAQMINERVVKNAAILAGHIPGRAISATGTLKFSLKTNIDLDKEIDII